MSDKKKPKKGITAKDKPRTVPNQGDLQTSDGEKKLRELWDQGRDAGGRHRKK